MLIRSRFSKDEEPIIEAVVSVPSYKIKKKIQFLIDTGSSHTSISQNDLKSLGIDINKLPKHRINVTGVGGEVETYVLEAVFLIFDTENDNYVHVVDELYVNKGSSPSILGRDFVNKFKLFLDWKKDLIIITDEDKLGF